ncbi:DUF3127 domain-containing protein [Myroides ceti]|uniref:DUF3127 domain-containing protein n=1 Tax=Paenimyroides ceti TaxID=395087 RepID=A0ABT8CXD1_9FLAO|nr:DUF3127 domain-containing protein [Paenimyroides ceti]MDN3709213.1 DUF3127 domain-containing protein [Paenimyroides ceti]
MYFIFFKTKIQLTDCEVSDISTLQLNCRCLQYKNKWINNIEIWRTGMQENFIGSIL